jgi:glucose/arabinose dehydrogenase
MIRTLFLLVTAASVAAQGPAYVLEQIPAPAGARFEVGGMDFLSDGRMVFSTRRGQVWILENPLCEDPADVRFSLFAEGLWEGMGLNVVDDRIYVVQRTELSELVDEDGDGLCDVVRTITNDWGSSGNYHEFAFGLPQFPDGDFLVTLNVSFFSPKWWHGKSPVPYRGWALKVSPEGQVTPWAHGFRSPCGVGTDADGELFVTDNQGDWVASSPIYHVERGGFYGHPASLEWTDEYRATGTRASDEVPPPAATRRRPAAIWIPYKWSRSTGNLVADTTGGKFGPFERQLFVAELTNGMVLRAGMERVQGDLQGWITPFFEKIGSVVRVAFAPDGRTLYCGMTNRGWGGRAPEDGLARIRYQGGVPFAVHDVHLLQDGFELTFTRPLAAEVQADAVQVTQYDYNYWWEYGSPRAHVTERAVSGLEVSEDRRKLTLTLDQLEPGMVASIRLSGLRSDSGVELSTPEVSYTVNQLPEGPKVDVHVSKIVPPPPSKESSLEGWMMLSWGDAMDRFESTGWELVEAELDRDDPTRFKISPGQGALVNTGAEPSAYVSKQEFSDCKLHLGFMLPKGGNSGVYLMGRYEVQLRDSAGVTDLGFGDCGGIYRGQSWPGSPPKYNGFRGPGEWHELDLEFEAPRFDAEGKKVRDARFVRVILDGKVVQEGVNVPQPTLGAIVGGEAAFGPLVIQGDHSPVALRDVRMLPRHHEDKGEGWTALFTDEDFDDWIVDGDAEWELDGETVISGGRRGHLFSARGDYGDFELRARFKVSDGGNSGLYFRAQPTGTWPTGYEAQINSSFPDPQKTGSLYGIAPVSAHMIPPDTWCTYSVRCQDVPGGTHVVVKVNGIVMVDLVDERRYGPGHIALQQHHEGSVVSFEQVQIRELK